MCAIKNAIYKYDYCGYGEYFPKTINIGDYIQSLAASQYFKNIDCLVDRDSLSQERENVKLIGNGWYWIDKERHAVGDNIDFLPISVHINNRGEEVADAVRTFAKRGGEKLVVEIL